MLVALSPGEEALAFRIADVEVTPGVELAGIYESNALLRSEDDPRGTPEDYIGRISPFLRLAYARGATDFALGYRNELLFYKDFPERDVRGSNHELTLSAVRPLGERTTLTLADLLQAGETITDITEIGFTDVEALTFLPARREFVRNGATLEISHDLTRTINALASLEYDYAHYDAFTREDGEREPQSDEHHVRGFVTGSYAWHRRNSVTASFGVTYHDYDRRGEAWVYTFAVGDRWQVTEALQLDGSVGFEYLSQELGTTGETSDSTNPYGALNATYELAEDLTFLANFFYGTQASSGIGTSVETLSVRLSAIYQATEKLRLDGFGFYSDGESVDQGDEGVADLSVESFQAGAGIHYQLLSWAAPRVEYTYIDQDADESVGASYKDHRVIVGITLTLPEDFP
ncbi:MAG: hypothetical protein AB1640_14055 [bacterium]